MSDLWRRSYFGICSGSVCVRDLWRRSYIGVCRGGVGCRTRVPCKSVGEEVSSKSVLQECHVRVSYKSVM